MTPRLLSSTANMDDTSASDSPDYLAFSAIQLIGTYVSQDLAPIVLECILFGVYTLLVLCTLVILVNSRARVALRSKKTVLLTACAVMYAAAAVHIGINLSCAFEDSRRSSAIRDMVLNCLVGDSNPCALLTMPQAYWGLAAVQAPDAAIPLTILVSINMALGDLVVLWRAIVLWPEHRAVRIVSTILFLGTLGTLMWNSTSSDQFLNYVASIAIFTSWVTNVWSTTLVIICAWKHRRRVTIHLRTASRRTRVETTLTLFIESGILYSALWIPLVIFSISNLLVAFWGTALGSLYTNSWARLEDFVQAVQASVLIDLVGMYPTIVILLLEVSNHSAERALSLNDIPTLPRPSLGGNPRPRSRVLRTLSVAEIPLEERGGGGDLRRSFVLSARSSVSDVEIGPKAEL